MAISDDLQLGKLIHEFSDRIGGVGRVGDLLAKCVEGICDPDSEDYSPGLAHKYLSLSIKALSQNDANAIQSDHQQQITEEQFQAAARRAAMDAVENDTEFRRKIVETALRRDTGLLSDILERAHNVFIVESEREAEERRLLAERQAGIPSAEQRRAERIAEQQRILEGCEVVEVDPAGEEGELEPIEEFDFL